MDSHERDRECGYDDILEEIIIMSPTESASGGVSSSSGSSYFSSPSDFNSPFGSEIGSTETESEDDDFISELSQLTRWMAEYTFQDEDEDEFLKSLTEETASTNSEATGLSVKLPNTDFNSVCLCNKEGFVNTTSEKASTDSVLPAMNLMSSEICSDKVLTDEQMRPVEVYQLKNQPETKNQGFAHGVKRMKEPQNMQNNKGAKSWRKRMLNPPLHPPPVPPATVSPQNGSGMRAFFLGGSSTRNGSNGTGVFLPTGAYRTTEPKKKPGGCSTVLIPARVLQTLQQHFNNVGAVSQSKGGDLSTNSQWQNDVLARINELLSQQKERAEFQPRPALARVINHDEEELKLPQEWTY